MPKLYISYNREDKDRIQELTNQLHLQKIEVLYDLTIIKDGNDWQQDLHKAMADADAILVLLSKTGVTSAYVNSELGMARIYAENGSKLLLPVIDENVPIPEFIRDRQAIRWNSAEQVAERVSKAIANFMQAKSSTKITTPSSSKTNGFTEAPTNYWILKMNPETWYIEDLRIGAETFFNTYYFGKERPEFKLFKEIKKGDHVLGLATGSYNGVVCDMVVTKEVGPNTKQGEGFEMSITELFVPHIPAQDLTDVIPEIINELNKDREPPYLFFSIHAPMYESIVSRQPTKFAKDGKRFQPFYLTEGNHQATEDQLGFDNDIDSFASVITLERVNPPLAIGLFGNWGSGKSFFMEKLSERIQQIVETKEADIVQHVVQVKFNSWHYSDANLWASLITQIFESLHDYAAKKQHGPEAIKAIYKDLNITGQQILEVEKKLLENQTRVQIITDKKTAIQTDIDVKKDKLTMWTGTDLVNVVLSDPFIKRDFQSIKDQFNAQQLIDNIQEVDEKLTEIKTPFYRFQKAISLISTHNKGKWIWIWILAVIAAALVWLLLGPLKDKIRHLVDGWIAASGIVLAWVVNASVWLSPWIKKVKQFYTRLESLKQTIDTKKEDVQLAEHSEIQKLNEEIRTLTEEKRNLDLEYKETQDRQTRLQNDINDIGTGRLLNEFLAGRSADDTYIKQLGIISWIRKDFSKLNDLFKKQESAQVLSSKIPVQLQIDRIILYIDDLDRCNEEVVVKVLEAIHLLLAFPLFVVIVGVDPRWLNNALTKKYELLFGRNGGNKPAASESSDSSPLISAATSYDYLEKIFQVPFALKPINQTGREKLISYLVRHEMSENTQTGTNIPEDGATPDESSKKTPTPDQTGADFRNAPSPGPTSTPKTAAKPKERLFFSKEELEYMQELSPIYGQTPRTINRYLNIYRLIKAHGNLKMQGESLKNEYKPVMFLLAVVVGYGEDAEKFIFAVSNNVDGMMEFKHFIKHYLPDPILVRKLEHFIQPIENIKMRDFKRNIELISRFSFRTLPL